nr:ATP synthase subunit I [Bacillus alkalicola]
MYTVILIIIFMVIALFFTNTQFFLGLTLGAVFSLFNLLSMYKQVKAIGNILDGGTAKWSFGSLARVIYAVLAVIIAMRFPEYFDLMGVIIGLMVTYVLILIEPIIYMRHHLKTK